MPESRPPKICDYEGSNYRTEFWEGQGRDYEDRAERLALRRLLPPEGGRRLLEIGAGFGRLTNEYHKYDQVVLLDYSFSQLQFARDHFGDSDRFVYVAADVYDLPFQIGTFDAATMVRVIHHMADVPAALAQIRRVLTPGATFILEHANKQNVKAMLRYALRAQDWSPYAYDPVEFVELNFDFHPQYIVDNLQQAKFDVDSRIPVSFFRMGLLKKLLPTGALVTLDGLLQNTGILYTPSIFVKSKATGRSANNLDTLALFVDPDTGDDLIREGDTMVCEATGTRYAVRDGIYDFKARLD